MTRRWVLWAVLSLLIGSALVIALAIHTPAASPTTIQGWWYRLPLAGEESFDASPNPHQLSQLLHFRQDGSFTAEDLSVVFNRWSLEAAPVSYPGTFTFVYSETFTFDSTQHIQLTIGTIAATYEIDFEGGHTHDELDHFILRNQGMRYTYYRAHTPLEM
jgi:hypothetical protein